MPNVITVNRVDQGLHLAYVYGTIALSGNYVQFAGAGEVLDFTKAVFPPGQNLPVSGAPISFAAWGFTGFGYGTPQWTALQAKLRVNSASGTEQGAGAYPAGVTADTIFFEAVFDSQV
jgi:hypothetical protein